MRSPSPILNMKSLIALTAACVLGAGCGARAPVSTNVPGPAATASSSQIPRSLTETIGLERNPTIAAVLADIDPARIRHTDSMLVWRLTMSRDAGG